MVGSRLAVIRSAALQPTVASVCDASRCVNTVGVVLLSNLAAKWAGSMLCVIIMLLVLPLMSSPYRVRGKAKA